MLSLRHCSLRPDPTSNSTCITCTSTSAAAVGTVIPPLQLHSLPLPPHPRLLYIDAGLGSASQHQHQLGHLCLPPHSSPTEFLQGSSRSSTRSPPDHVVSSAKHSSFQQETEEKGWSHMMLSDTESVPISSTSLRAAISSRLHGSTNSIFTFDIHQKPEMALIFLPRPSPPRPRKRCRAVTDIDGEHSSLQKKKRRLRLFLITSRLSPEFSSPATNIVDRGTSKIAVWAKQKALGRNLLRKAAILNRIRRRGQTPKEKYEDLGPSLVEQEREQKQLELARLAFVYGSHDTHTRPVVQKDSPFPPTTVIRVGDRFNLSGSPNAPSSVSSPSSSSTSSPNDEAENSTFQSPNDAYSNTPCRTQTPRRTYIPLPPSPLGLSNYDAFDLEDDIPDPYAHFDDDNDEDQYDQDLSFNPASPSANTSSSFTSTIDTGPSETLRTPPQMIYSDFSILDPGEPVIGDYDQVDEGADAIWPNALGYGGSSGYAASASNEGNTPRIVSCSPNFPAIFATAREEVELPKEGVAALVPSWSMASSVPDSRPGSHELDEERDRQRAVMFTPFGS